MASLIVYLAAATACALAQSLAFLSAARFVQGCAAVFGPVLVRAIVRDLHANEAAARLMGRVTLAFAIMPIVMPLLGGMLVTLEGWRAVFWMQALFAAALLVAVITRLPETAPAVRQPMRLSVMLQNYAHLLRQPKFIAPTAVALCSQMGVYVFVTNSSLVVIPVLGFSPNEYAMMFALIMIGYISGARYGAKRVMRMGISRTLTVASLMAATGGALMAILSLAGIESGAAIIIPMAIFMFSNGVLTPSTTAAALSPFPAIAGQAASLQSIIHLLGGTALGLGLSQLHDGSTLPLAACLGLLGLSQLLLERHYHRRGVFTSAT